MNKIQAGISRRVIYSIVFSIAAAALMSSPLRAEYFVDTFDGPDLNPRWTNENSPKNPSGSNIVIVTDNVFKWAVSTTGYTNYYNHIQAGINAEGNFYVQVDARGHNGESWGPGLVVYWDNTHFVGLKAPRGGYFRSEVFNGSIFSIINSSEIYDGWNLATLRIEFDSDTIRFYAKNELDTALTYLSGLDILRSQWTKQPGAMLIIGKGFQSDTYTMPDYDNDYASSGSVDSVYIDNAKYLSFGPPPPLNKTFYASFDNSLDADYANGDVNASAVPGASGLPATGSQARNYFDNSIDFGKISDHRAVRYPTAGNLHPEKGSVEFWWKPRYGSEIINAELIFRAGSDADHYMHFEKAWSGANGMYGRFIYKNGASQTIAGNYCSQFYPQTWQHIVLNWDYSTSEISFYINGHLGALAAGFAPLSAAQLGDWFYLNWHPIYPYWGSCCIDELIIRDGPQSLTSPYETPLTAENAPQPQKDRAAAEDNAMKRPPSVADARAGRFGILMDVTGMARDSMYNNETSYGAYIQQMADRGVTFLALRTTDIGNFTYYTNLEQLVIWPENYNVENLLRSFDHLAALVQYAHAAGIKAYIWNTMFDEGSYPPPALGGAPSLEVGSWVHTLVDPTRPWARYTIFARNNPDKLWQHKDGRRSALALSYAYPEVRNYRIALLEEAMAYGIDGVILDTTRWAWMDGRYLTGIYDDNNITLMGYDQPILDAWAADSNNPPIATVSNSDPNWLKFRANMSMTQLLRELKPVTNAYGVELGVVVDGKNNLGYSLSDVQGWLDEQLVDVIYPTSREGSPAITLPWRWYEIAREWMDMANGQATVNPCMPTGWLDPDNLSIPMLSTVFNASARGMILYEAEAMPESHYVAIETLKRIDLFGNTADLNADEFVNFNDFAQLADRWLDDNCITPYWCNGADLVPNKDGVVNFLDLVNFANDWLTYQQHKK